MSIDDRDVTGPIHILSTFAEVETVPWRQWHHWNLMQRIVEIRLEKGTHVLTLTTVAEGNMNYDYLEFDLKE